MLKSITLTNKVAILKEIKENKDYLFGTFSKTSSKTQNCDVWKTIHNKTASLGFMYFDKILKRLQW